MRILSLFDGMSCAQIALNRLGVNKYTYYASELDKYAIKVTQANYPSTIQVGDVTKLKGEDYQNIDLLVGGSPCQGFSFAGKQLNFDDPRSKLFFEFVRILKEVKPKYFLLENVRMKKEYQDVISGHLGVEPIMINSSLVSAQNRVRLYWTNIPGVTQPKEKNLILKDILEKKKVDDRYYLSDKIVKGFKGGSGAFKGRFNPMSKDKEKSYCLTARYYKMGRTDPYVIEDLRPTLFKYSESRRYKDKDGKVTQHVTEAVVKTKEHRLIESDKSLTLLTSDGCCGGSKSKNLVFIGGIEEYRRLYNGKNLSRNYKERGRVYSINGKAATIPVTPQDMAFYADNKYFRKLTPLECERLQTVPDNYTNHVSNTQRYKMLGNGFTVDVIAHILNYIWINDL